MTSIENCARWCLLSSNCDMFYYSVGTCEMHQNERRKFFNIYEIVEEDTIPTGNIYILHCSAAMENWVDNSDHYGRSLNRKTLHILNTLFKICARYKKF